MNNLLYPQTLIRISMLHSSVLKIDCSFQLANLVTRQRTVLTRTKYRAPMKIPRHPNARQVRSPRRYAQAYPDNDSPANNTGAPPRNMALVAMAADSQLAGDAKNAHFTFSTMPATTKRQRYSENSLNHIMRHVLQIPPNIGLHKHLVPAKFSETNLTIQI